MTPDAGKRIAPAATRMTPVQICWRACRIVGACLVGGGGVCAEAADAVKTATRPTRTIAFIASSNHLSNSRCQDLDRRHAVRLWGRRTGQASVALSSLGSGTDAEVVRRLGTGRLGGQAVVPGVAGSWKDLTYSVNAMSTNGTGPG